MCSTNVLFVLIFVFACNVAAADKSPTAFVGCQQSYYNGSIVAISFNVGSTCTVEEIKSIGEVLATAFDEENSLAALTASTGLEISLETTVCPDAASTDVSTQRFLALKGRRELATYKAKFRYKLA
jgi:hypothetical protein